MVDEFKNGAAQKNLMRSRSEEFLSRVNAELSELGYGMDICVSGKSVELVMTCPNQEPRPVAHCSTGEQSLAAWAVALAFGDTGAPVMLDDLNQLDIERRDVLLDRLNSETVGTVVVAGAWQTRASVAEYFAGRLGATTVWMEQGAAA